MLVTLLVILAASCTEEKRYRILSSLFDGVPPLGGGTSQTGSSNSLRPARPGEESLMYAHEPVAKRQCVKCHGDNLKGNFSREVQLEAPVPDLCFGCHEEMASLEGWVHGPVAAGDCLMCHEPHRSKNQHLLKYPVPDMCFRCHDPKAIAEIPNHGEPVFKKCLLCHFGHTSQSRYLLRSKIPDLTALQQWANQPSDQAQPGSADQVALEAAGKIRDGRSIEEMLADVQDFVKKDQIDQAKSYVKAIMQSSAYTDAQKRSIVPALLRLQEQLGPVAVKPAEPLPPKQQQTPQVPEDRTELGHKQMLSPEQTGALYMLSLESYKAGELLKAKSGFQKVLYEGTVPEPVKQAIRRYLSDIDKALSR